MCASCGCGDVNSVFHIYGYKTDPDGDYDKSKSKNDSMGEADD